MPTDSKQLMEQIEYAAALLNVPRVASKSVVKLQLRERFGNLHARAIEAILTAARRLLAERGAVPYVPPPGPVVPGKQALAVYDSVAADVAAPVGTRNRAERMAAHLRSAASRVRGPG